MSVTGPADKCVFFRTQLSNTSNVNVPCTGTAVLHPATKTLDLHIVCRVEQIATLDGSFGYFTLSSILAQAGVQKISLPVNTLFYGQAVPFGNSAGTDTETLMGRAGLIPCFTSKTSPVFGLGRVYDNQMAVGTWPLNKTNLIVVGRGYSIDLYGLQYE